MLSSTICISKSPRVCISHHWNSCQCEIKQEKVSQPCIFNHTTNSKIALQAINNTKHAQDTTLTVTTPHSNTPPPPPHLSSVKHGLPLLILSDQSRRRLIDRPVSPTSLWWRTGVVATSRFRWMPRVGRSWTRTSRTVTGWTGCTPWHAPPSCSASSTFTPPSVVSSWCLSPCWVSTCEFPPFLLLNLVPNGKLLCLSSTNNHIRAVYLILGWNDYSTRSKLNPITYVYLNQIIVLVFYNLNISCAIYKFNYL